MTTDFSVVFTCHPIYTTVRLGTRGLIEITIRTKFAREHKINTYVTLRVSMTENTI